MPSARLFAASCENETLIFDFHAHCGASFFRYREYRVHQAVLTPCSVPGANSRRCAIANQPRGRIPGRALAASLYRIRNSESVMARQL